MILNSSNLFAAFCASSSFFLLSSSFLFTYALSSRGLASPKMEERATGFLVTGGGAGGAGGVDDGDDAAVSNGGCDVDVDGVALTDGGAFGTAFVPPLASRGLAPPNIEGRWATVFVVDVGKSEGTREGIVGVRFFS